MDKDGVQDNIQDRAGKLNKHGLEGPSGGLEQPLTEDLGKNTYRKDTADAGVGNAALHRLPDAGLHLIIGPYSKEAEQHKNRRTHQRQKDALSCRPVSGFLILPPQTLGQQGVDTDTHAHGKANLHILHREGQGQGRHGTLRHLGHIHAIHNVVQRLHQHRNNHWKRHVDQQLPHGHNAHFVLF